LEWGYVRKGEHAIKIGPNGFLYFFYQKGFDNAIMFMIKDYLAQIYLKIFGLTFLNNYLV